jgi:hypothetical protein
MLPAGNQRGVPFCTQNVRYDTRVFFFFCSLAKKWVFCGTAIVLSKVYCTFPAQNGHASRFSLKDLDVIWVSDIPISTKLSRRDSAYRKLENAIRIQYALPGYEYTFIHNREVLSSSHACSAIAKREGTKPCGGRVQPVIFSEAGSRNIPYTAFSLYSYSKCVLTPEKKRTFHISQRMQRRNVREERGL